MPESPHGAATTRDAARLDTVRAAHPSGHVRN
jgi:hypothetical protein